MTDLAPPSSRLTTGEVRALREPVRLALALPKLRRRPGVERRTVVTVPGYGADDRALAPLRAHLRRAGHRALGWDRGRNDGDVERMWPRLVDRVHEVAADADGPVDLVGWSLGGVLARETGRDVPDLVGRVVTMGTPVVGGPRYTRAGAAYGEERITAIEQLIEDRERRPIPVPVTALWSKRDGIVAWEACIDRFDNDVEHVEVTSTHFGMLLDPDVWRHVADVVGRTPAGSGDRAA